jgi:hypothetical protein
VTDTNKRRRPSAKEARARMARAVATPSPISRTEEEPDGRTGSEEVRSRESGGDAGQEERGRRGGRDGSLSEGEKLVEKLVRLSVDVPRSQHRFLRVEAAQAGTTGMAVVRALISEMETNEDLAERVRGRLESE